MGKKCLHIAVEYNLIIIFFIATAFRSDDVCNLPPNHTAKTGLISHIYSANILMLPMSQFPALNKFSVLFCILGECITLVLFQEQRKLDGTGAATGVSTLAPPF
jgi:hypothetical protein